MAVRLKRTFSDMKQGLLRIVQTALFGAKNGCSRAKNGVCLNFISMISIG